MEFEEKTFPFEIKALTDEGTFEGYAAIFGTPDALGEVVMPGAFNKTIKEGKRRPMLWYHDPRNPIGTAELEIDEKGLKIRGEFDMNVQAAREKHSLMKKGAIRGLSFGFNTIKDIWKDSTRFLKEVKLFEISPVTFQAHDKAMVTSVKQWSEEKPFPNEHGARLKSPDLFDEKTYKRTHGGTIYGSKKIPATIDIIWAKLKGSTAPSDNPHPQALRFPTKTWTVAAAKKWLKDNDIKYERFEAATKSFEGVIEFLEEQMETKEGRSISGPNLKLIKSAIEALSALLKAAEPSKDTQAGKGMFAPIIEALERPDEKDKPREHLFGPIIKDLENSNKEK